METKQLGEMNKRQKIRLYESIMRDLSVQVRQRLDEDTFKAPRKNVKERFLTLLGKESGYKERVRKMQEEYFEEKRRRRTKHVQNRLL